MRKSFIKIAGFTLAEVPITLTIIGVIAALTIPALIQDIQDAQYHTAWKRAYSDLNQATQHIIADNGGTMIGLCNDGDYACSKLNNEYRSYFSYTKSCDIHPSDDGCWHLANNWFNLDKTTAGQFDDSPRKYYDTAGGLVLNNGDLIVFDWYSSSCSSGNWSGPGIKCGHMAVDINGYKGPNTIGKDIYAVWITANGLKPVGSSNVDTFQCAGYGWGCSAKYLYQ